MMTTLKVRKQRQAKPKLLLKVLKEVMTEKMDRKTRSYLMILIELLELPTEVELAKIMPILMIRRALMMKRYNKSTTRKT
jgi:hypothetical protein